MTSHTTNTTQKSKFSGDHTPNLVSNAPAVKLLFLMTINSVSFLSKNHKQTGLLSHHVCTKNAADTKHLKIKIFLGSMPPKPLTIHLLE
jgi:hypothetical protein